MYDNLKERLTDMSVLASSRTPADALQYIEELEAENADLKAKLATCKKYRDAYAECDRIATQAVRDLKDKLEKAVDALGEAIYLLDPDEEDIAKETGLHRIVTTYAELRSSEAANGEAKGGKDE